ncbi:hypothetical protein [Prevotella sp. 885]|uniref:hypothetical protein n=1 Tax=Prevotella sp. 885 TaxID=2022527 RepID=UPI000BA078B8|nr:hypothetical protein [Prevotella sp. 885]OZT04992.1 hypothetical protein CHL74_02030 [Prevotella sp. 885]
MANIKNLSRIHEIAESLPKLEDARKLLSQDESLACVGIPTEPQPDGKIKQGTMVVLPKEVKLNILNVLNLEINKQKEELKGL